MSLPATAPSAKVLELERVMREMPQVEMETRHHFAGGMYARELVQPAGTVVVGKVHKKEHFYIITKGRVRVVMDGMARDYEAPAVIVSQPGTKRAIYAVTDAVYMTVHRTKKRNIERIERELVEEDKLALFDAGNRLRPRALEAP